MSVMYIHLQYEEYKSLQRQMAEYEETTHTTVTGFYHKSIRLVINPDLIIEFHGPNVGGKGHLKLVNSIMQEPIEYLGRETRGHRGIRAAAREIGVSPTTLSRIERGFPPSMKTYKKLQEWLAP